MERNQGNAVGAFERSTSVVDSHGAPKFDFERIAHFMEAASGAAIKFEANSDHGAKYTFPNQAVVRILDDSVKFAVTVISPSKEVPKTLVNEILHKGRINTAIGARFPDTYNINAREFTMEVRDPALLRPFLIAFAGLQKGDAPIVSEQPLPWRTLG